MNAVSLRPPDLALIQQRERWGKHKKNTFFGKTLSLEKDQNQQRFMLN